MAVEEQDIRDITGAVWNNVLGADAERSGSRDGDLSGTVLTGCVQFSGAWEGAATIQCSPGLARGAAARMWGADPGAVSSDDVVDALGELVNMVGGNIKALLPGPTQLSLPLVVEGTRRSLTIRDVEPVHAVWFASHGESFVVTLLQRSQGATAGA